MPDMELVATSLLLDVPVGTKKQLVLKAATDLGQSRLGFKYENWRGENHVYEIMPEAVECGPWDSSGQHEGRPYEWVMHGYVVTRDGDNRRDMGANRRRTFLMRKMTELRTVDPKDPTRQLDDLTATIEDSASTAEVDFIAPNGELLGTVTKAEFDEARRDPKVRELLQEADQVALERQPGEHDQINDPDAQ
jgi:hypothetical protein